MSHDPLCRNRPNPATRERCGDCELVAKVRADERKKAAQRIIALCAHTKYVGVMPCEHDRAVAAVLDEL